MKLLYAPWRSVYTNATARSKNEGIPSQECVFCSITRNNTPEHDEKHFVLGRYEHAFVALNLFPYNAGHILVIPYTHCAELELLDQPVRAQIMDLIAQSIAGVKKALKAEAVNVGMNLGKTAGAGIPAHLHTHVLPRWAGDTSFLPTLAHTKAISFDLVEIYQQLKPHF